MLYKDDCYKTMKTLEDNTIDMIYLDPPFFSQKEQVLFSSKGEKMCFSDEWKSLESYLEFMRIRLWEMQRILKESGCIFLHCDSKASHHLRLLLDSIFGAENFRSEIIWSYKRWSNSKKGLLPGHQTIFFYSKSSHFKFNTIYGEYSPTTNIDQILQERVRNNIGKSVYKRDEAGEIVQCKGKKGVPLSDVWDIPFLNPKAKERTGYPTQKPIELLEQIIKISTDPNDIVLDPFCGSGTTLVAAELLGRKAIGIDINADAIRITKQRLQAPLKTTSLLLKVGSSSYRTKTENELAILKQFDCNVVQRNKGIDAFLKKHYNNAPVAIKIQRVNETLDEAILLLDMAGKKKKCSFTVLITISDSANSNIPSNMIILPRYEYLLANKIAGKLF